MRPDQQNKYLFAPQAARARYVAHIHILSPTRAELAGECVTEAAGNLQAAGLIKYSRGHTTIVDRAGIEARTCECYAVVKKESDRLLPNRVAS
jgi:hypothetical protein